MNRKEFALADKGEPKVITLGKTTRKNRHRVIGFSPDLAQSRMKLISTSLMEEPPRIKH